MIYNNHIVAMMYGKKATVLVYLAAQAFTDDQLDDLLEEVNAAENDTYDQLEELSHLPWQRNPYTGIYENGEDEYFVLQEQAEALNDLANLIEEYQMALENQRQYA